MQLLLGGGEKRLIPMIDGCGRQIDHLRLSLTDHCNLACRYCVPEAAVISRHMIEVNFAFQIVRWLSQHYGIRCVRLTGGEPLVYRRLIPLVERLSALGDCSPTAVGWHGQSWCVGPTF